MAETLEQRNVGVFCKLAVGSLALMVATEVSILGRKDIQRYLVCISAIGWVVSAVSSHTQWWLIMIFIRAPAFAIRSVFVLQ